MASFKRFEDILAWQKGRELVTINYNLIQKNTGFQKDFILKDQITRASYSICLNIAEGFGRRTNGEFKHFLVISHGSVSEIQSALYLALDRKYINDEEFNETYLKCEEISKMLMGLIKYLK